MHFFELPKLSGWSFIGIRVECRRLRGPFTFDKLKVKIAWPNCCSKSQSVGILAAALDAVKGELSARSILSLTADPPALSLPRRAQCMAVRLTLRIRNVWGLAIKLRIVVVVAVAAAAVARSLCCCGIPTIARFICLAGLSGSQTLVEVGWNRERGRKGGHIRQVYKQSAWLAV